MYGTYLKIYSWSQPQHDKLNRDTALFQLKLKDTLDSCLYSSSPSLYLGSQAIANLNLYYYYNTEYKYMTSVTMLNQNSMSETHASWKFKLWPISLYPQTKIGDILDSGPSRRCRCRRRRRNFLVDAITQKQINIFFSNLVHMLRMPKGRSLF